MSNEDIAERASKLGLRLLKNLQNEPEYNNLGEFVLLTPETTCYDAINAFNIAIKHRGEPIDYFLRGRAYTELCDHIQDNKEPNYRKAIQDFDKIIPLAPDASDIHWRGVAKSMLADYVDAEERIQLLNEAIDDLSHAVELRGEDIDYHWLAATRIELADHQDFERQRQTLTEAIDELERMNKFEAEDHFWMGIGKNMIADIDPGSAPCLRREAIDHLRRAYKKLQDEYTEGLIEEIKSRL